MQCFVLSWESRDGGPSSDEMMCKITSLVFTEDRDEEIAHNIKSIFTSATQYLSFI